MEETNSLVVKEKKNTVAKIWNKIVGAHVKYQKTSLKMAPLTLKVVSIIEPEAAPVLKPLSKFLKTKGGKKFTEVMSNSYDAMGNLLTGKVDEAKNQFKNNISNISSEEGLKSISGMKDTIDEIKGMTK